MSETVRAYLALGSNLGERVAQIRQAIGLLQAHGAIRIRQISRFYETAPEGIVSERDPQWFVNAVIGIDTEFSPEELLAVCLSVEQRLGRQRPKPDSNAAFSGYSSRTLDIDILLYGDGVIDTPSLQVPHPRMHQRSFMMTPLQDVAPHVIHPVLGQSIREISQNLQSSEQALRLFGQQVLSPA